MNDTYVLQMEGIEKEYSGVKVLRGIDLQVRPGEVVSIVGENGAGKSTLMNILFGMPVIHSTGGFKGSVQVFAAVIAQVKNQRGSPLVGQAVDSIAEFHRRA